jgi:arylsulfatase A-like enzyme
VNNIPARKDRADTLNGLTEKWLQSLPVRSRTPFFVYLHYIEPHAPYIPPDEFLTRVSRHAERPSVDMVHSRLLGGDPMNPDPETVSYIEELYDGEVAALDAGIRDLFAMLERRHLLDNTVLVFTGDHGEGFNEHGFMGHGGILYNEVIHVPLIIVYPGQSTRVDVREPVSLLDIAPTLLELIGIPAPRAFEGHSLDPAVFRARHPWRAWLRHWWSGGAGPRPVFSEKIYAGTPKDGGIHHERAVIVKDRKLITSLDGARESYDLSRDPGEQTAVVNREEERMVELMGVFEARYAQNSHEAPTIDPELRARLTAMGYVD